MIILFFALLLITSPLFINAQNGIVKTYHFSGKVASRVSFVDEILEGTSYWYYENGNLESEKNYSNGKMNGLIRNFFSSGLLKDETHADNGVLHGVFRSYYENGALKSIKTYEGGQLLSVNTLDYDSNYIAPLAAYNAGKKKKSIENNDFICAIEICPEPVGGLEEIQANIIYPKLAKQFGLEGSVLLIATISKVGLPENIKIIEGLGLGCSEAAVEAVKKTRFIPGRINGDEVISDVTFKLYFSLNQPEKKSKELVNNNISLTEENRADQPEKVEQKDFIICNIGECPKPIGGITELLKKLRYPSQAKRNNISGDVIVQAKVNDIGFVISAEVIEGIGYGCDEAAKSVVIKTQFEPGKMNDLEAESIIKITIPFILEKQN